MKCIIANDVLLKGLQAISNVVSTSSSLPILENFLFQIKNEELFITASDMETSVKVQVPVIKVENDGEIAIPTKILLETLKTLPNIPVSISVEDKDNPHLIEIVAGEGRFKLAGYDPDDYPKRPVMEDSKSITANSQAIANGISKTIFASLSDMLRPAMTGIFCDFSDEHLNVVATDAHRLVRYRRTDIKSKEPFSFILPKKTSNVLKNLLSTLDTDVKIEFNNTNASFTFENFNLVCRLIDQKYPNYEAVIPSENPNILTVNRIELINALKRVTIYANQSTYQVKFNITGQLLTLSSEDIDFSNEAVEKINCSYDGTDMDIGFNAKFIIEMIQNLDTESVKFEMSEPKRAGLILPVETDDEKNDAEDILMLVMPINISNN